MGLLDEATAIAARTPSSAIMRLVDKLDGKQRDEVVELIWDHPDIPARAVAEVLTKHYEPLDVCGTLVTWAHGHQFGGGSTAEAKAKAWLSGQALGKEAAGDCDLLVTGHYHHLCVAQWGATGWVQAPALDGGSQWWRNKTGAHSPPGVLSLVVGAGVSAAGWSHLHTLGETVAE